MKRIYLLRILVTLAFTCCLAFIIFGIPFTVIFSLFPGLMPATLHTKVETLRGSGRYVLPHLFLIIGATACNAYALFRIKEMLKLFEKNIFFDERVSKHFNIAGRMVLCGFLLQLINDTFYITHDNFVGFNLDIDLTTFVLPSAGLLLLALSDVFSKAKTLKDENDLTV
ncbi:MAG: DUF2975 domain-containing protein [Bacteroidia bacterium]